MSSVVGDAVALRMLLVVASGDWKLRDLGCRRGGGEVADSPSAMSLSRAWYLSALNLDCAQLRSDIFLRCWVADNGVSADGPAG